MFIRIVAKKDILKIVHKTVAGVRKEIIATMLLEEERTNPLPYSYHAVLIKKLRDDVQIKRLGFGRKVDYTVIKKRLAMSSKNYQFRYTPSVSAYQRLLIIDRKILFFGAGGIFFQSSYKPLIEAFLHYFIISFKKGKV